MQHTSFSKQPRLLITLALVGRLIQIASLARQANAGETHTMMLPLVFKNTQPASTLPNKLPELIALDCINAYRALTGVPLLQLHPALIAAAQHHANYDLLNYGDQAAWSYGPHGEVSGKPGFTGEMPGDRVSTAQYPWAAGWEVMGYFDNPQQTVDALMMTVFHRITILAPAHQYAGYGHGRSAVEYVDVIDFGRGSTNPTGPPDVVAFPAANMSEIPLYGASETPSPLPPGASYPIGYPITIQPVFGTALTVTQAELRDSASALIPVHPNPPGCETDCFALIPTPGLKTATTYTVHVAGSVDGVPFEKTWKFTTTTCSNPLSC
jgi:uncharacterized protein YkwD